MSAACVVEVRAGADAASRWAVAVLVAAAVALFVAWVFALAGASTGALGAAPAAGLWAGVMAWRCRDGGTGLLRWEGRRWQWVPDRDAPAVEGALTVAVDLDIWLLLRFDAVDGRRRWMAVSRARDGARWHALRCAVHARGAGAGAVARLPV
jgi:hypothetical protein